MDDAISRLTRNGAVKVDLAKSLKAAGRPLADQA
jgi:hypothetical protein